MEKNIFIFDKNKCVGCHACIVACMNENGFQANSQWRNVHKSNIDHHPDLPLFYLSLACNHCDDAPCLKNCPAQAYSRDEKTGAIIHDPEKCIGCKYCTWACPYDAPKFNTQKGIIEKCTFCNTRIEDGLEPACVNSCPTGALEFTKMEFDKKESYKSSPVPVEVGSSIKIKELRNNKGPEMDSDLFKDHDKNYLKKTLRSKITLKEEWPLLIFTLLITGMVSFYASSVNKELSVLVKHILTLSGIVAGILSSLHLGKKFRAWRSIINVKNSWLSKEIALFGLFFLMIITDFYIFNIPQIFAITTGILLLLSIDMLYRIAKWQWSLQIHSANTLLIGLTLTAFLINYKLVVIFLIAFRLTLYIYRKYKTEKHIFILRSLLRILLPITALSLIYYNQTTTGILIFLLGEIIDRIEFYSELNVPIPQTEIQYKN